MSFAQSASDLLSKLVWAHEHRPAGQLNVLPVITDDLVRLNPIIDAFAQLTGARIFDASECADPVPATSESVRLAICSRPLVVGRGGLRKELHTNIVAGTATASIATSGGGTPSPGDRELIGLSHIAAHAELDLGMAAVVIYREGLLDRAARRAAWQVAVERMVSLPHPSFRTLVVVVEGGIDPDLHCEAGAGFRFGFDGDRLVTRRGMDDLYAMAAQIVADDGPVVFFLGAGFSYSSRMPLGNSLRDAAIARMLGLGDPRDFPSGELPRRFATWIYDHRELMSAAEIRSSVEAFATELTLEQVVRVEMLRAHASDTLVNFKKHHDSVLASPGGAVIDLGRVLAGGGLTRPVLVTVNFDRLVETHAGCPVRVFATDSEFEVARAYIESYLRGDESDIPLLKIHGSIERPESCVVSASQTERGVSATKEAAILAAVGSQGPPTAWFYVGASMRDRDLSPFLMGSQFSSRVDERWVAPYLVESVEQFGLARETAWRESGRQIDGRIVAETADSFFGAVARAAGVP